jgi:hypothetical protein
VIAKDPVVGLLFVVRSMPPAPPPPPPELLEPGFPPAAPPANTIEFIPWFPAVVIVKVPLPVKE